MVLLAIGLRSLHRGLFTNFLMCVHVLTWLLRFFGYVLDLVNGFNNTSWVAVLLQLSVRSLSAIDVLNIKHFGGVFKLSFSFLIVPQVKWILSKD